MTMVAECSFGSTLNFKRNIVWLELYLKKVQERNKRGTRRSMLLAMLEQWESFGKRWTQESSRNPAAGKSSRYNNWSSSQASCLLIKKIYASSQRHSYMKAGPSSAEFMILQPPMNVNKKQSSKNNILWCTLNIEITNDIHQYFLDINFCKMTSHIRNFWNVIIYERKIKIL